MNSVKTIEKCSHIVSNQVKLQLALILSVTVTLEKILMIVFNFLGKRFKKTKMVQNEKSLLQKSKNFVTSVLF